jgi:hypothetical protein
MTVEVDGDHLASFSQTSEHWAEHLQRPEPAVKQKQGRACAMNLVAVADAARLHMALFDLNHPLLPTFVLTEDAQDTKDPTSTGDFFHLAQDLREDGFWLERLLASRQLATREVQHGEGVSRAVAR